jgi:HK97 family phage prohead protease
LVAGFANVAVLDRQGDIVPTDAMAKAMLEYMKRGGVVLLGHANKPVGKVVQWSIQKPEGSDADGIHIIAAIDTGTEPGDEAWKKLGNKTITGFSIGGSAKESENVRDKAAVGGVARELKGVELHEISLVEIPANQLATVSDISVAKSCDNGTCKMEKEVHRGPFAAKEEADKTAQKLKQEGWAVYRIVQDADGWYIDFGSKENPANETGREEMHPKTKQPVLMAQKTLEDVKAMGLDWESSKEEAEKAAQEMKAEGFKVYEIVPDGDEWRIDYGREENPARKTVDEKTKYPDPYIPGQTIDSAEIHRRAEELKRRGEEKAEGAPEDPTVKAEGPIALEQDPNYDQTKYGVQSMGKDAVEKGGNEQVRRKVGFEIAGARVRSVSPDGSRGTWHRMTDSERGLNRLYGAGELSAATNIPSGFQPAQPIPKKSVEEKDAVSTGEAGVENARFSPPQKPEDIEKPFKSRAQQRWMFWADPKMAREWAHKTPNIRSLPERASKKDVIDGDEARPVGAEDGSNLVPEADNKSHPVTGEEAFTERAEGPQGDKYGEFGEKSVEKLNPTDQEAGDGTCTWCKVKTKVHEDPRSGKPICEACAAELPNKAMQPEQLKPGYQEGKESSTGKPVMHEQKGEFECETCGKKPMSFEECVAHEKTCKEMPPDSCDECGKKGTTRRGLCEQCEADAVNEARAKKGLTFNKAGKCRGCGCAGHELVDGRYCQSCYEELQYLMAEAREEFGQKKALQQRTGVPSTIQVAGGTATYVGTEVEDKNGRWDDSYKTSDGYWVIHHGSVHDVYQKSVEKEPRDATDDANVGPTGLAAEPALQSSLDAKKEGSGTPAKGSGGRTIPASGGRTVKPSGGRTTKLLMALAGVRKEEKSVSKELRLVRALAGVELEKSGAMCKRCGSSRRRLYKRKKGMLCGKCVKAIRTRALKQLAGIKK